MYQGGELLNNPDVKNLLKQFGYTIHTTGYDTFYQNGPAEQSHRTSDNSIRYMLTGANLDIKIFHFNCTMLSKFKIHFQKLIQLLLRLRKINPSDITSTTFGPLDVVSMCEPLETENSS